MPGILPYLVTALLYGALALTIWRNQKRPVGEHPAAPGWPHYAVLLPLTLHGILLFQTVFSEYGIYLGVGDALSITAWLAVLIYWFGNFFFNLQGLQALVVPLAALCSLLPAVFPATHPLLSTGLPAFKAHLLISLLAYGFFTIAALHVVLMSLLQRKLHGHKLPAFLENLPPLLTMETLLFRIIGAGFVLLTLTLGSGILFSEEMFGRPLQFNHKTLFGFISWIVFAVLLGGRQIYGWRGRIALRWTWGGLITLLLAYLGTKFVLEIILHR